MTRYPLLASPECRQECRPVAWCEDSAVLGIEGEGGSPPCGYCRRDLKMTVDPARPVQPHRPASARRRRGGDHDLVPSRWDEALDRLAIALRPVVEGRGDLLWINGNQHPAAGDVLGRRICGLLPGSTHVTRRPPAETLARWADALIPASGRANLRDLERADPVLLWGADVARGPWEISQAVSRARANGAHVIYVGPADTQSAREADLWLPLRPGADLPLAMGLAAACLGNLGGTELSDSSRALLEPWSLERSAALCRLDPLLLDQVATLVSRAPRPVLVGGEDLLLHSVPEPTMRALGLWLEAAGVLALLPRPAADPGSGLTCPAGAQSMVARTSGDLAQLLADRPAQRSVVVIEGADPLDCWPESRALRSHLDSAEFVAVLAPWHTQVCDHADLVLPVTSVLESADAVGLRWNGKSRIGQAALKPPRGVKTPGEIWRTVAQRFDWSLAWFPAQGSELLEQVALDPALPVPLPRKSSTSTLDFRPLGESQVSTPALHREFPLQLVPAIPPRLVERRGNHQIGDGRRREALVTLSVIDANARGIEDCSPVKVLSQRGEVEGLAVVDPQQPAGIVGVTSRLVPRTFGVGDLTLLAEGLSGDEVLAGCLVEVVT